MQNQNQAIENNGECITTICMKMIAMLHELSPLLTAYEQFELHLHTLEYIILNKF